MSAERKIAPEELRQTILKLLAGREMYGYALLRAIRGRTPDALAGREGHLYPILHGLEVRGLLRSRWRPTDDDKLRKFYVLTRRARARLAERAAPVSRPAPAANEARMEAPAWAQ